MSWHHLGVMLCEWHAKLGLNKYSIYLYIYCCNLLFGKGYFAALKPNSKFITSEKLFHESGISWRMKYCIQI